MPGLPSSIWTAINLGYDKFFRARLLTLDSDGVAKYVDGMDDEINEIRIEALRMAWYMRGGLTYDQALQLSISERKLIGQIIKDNMETTKKTNMPFF